MEYEQSIQKWDLKIQEEALGNQKKRRRILIVDDEPDTCMSFKQYWKMLCMNVYHIQIQLKH
jgi:response regulator RpfG family c-di-GMP phosphodiesterase